MFIIDSMKNINTERDHHMTLLQYEVFRKVIETGSFTKAGEVMGLTQSAVSHAIKGLESELGIALLIRGRSGLKLTNEGERLLDYIRKILNLAEQMKQEAAAMIGLEIGTFRIGTFPSVSAKLLPGIIKAFKEKYPNITVDFFEGGYETIKNWLAQGIIDLGFVTLPSDPTFDTIPLIQDDIVILLPEKHPLSRQSVILLEQIASEPFIMPKDGCDIIVKKMFKAKRLKPNIQFEISDNNTIISMIKENIGISIVPKLTLFHQIEGIKVVKFDEDVYRTIGLALLSRQTASPSVKAFINVAKIWLAANNYNPPLKYSKYC